MRTSKIGIGVIATVSFIANSSSYAASMFKLMGNPPGISFVAGGISADGSTVVGTGIVAVAPFDFEAYRWDVGPDGVAGTVDDEMNSLGDLPGGDHWSIAGDATTDGSSVVGIGTDVSGREVYLWRVGPDGIAGTPDDEMIETCDFLDGESFFGGPSVSADGETVAASGDGLSGPEAMLCTVGPDGIWDTGDEVVAGLGDLPGGQFGSYVGDMSADGSTVVGSSLVVPDAMGILVEEAFRWTESTAMIGLGDLPGGDFGSRATAVSPDGRWVAGAGEGTLGDEAFRWYIGADGIVGTGDDEMIGLGHLPGQPPRSSANGISADGFVVVGTTGSSLDPGDAFVWYADGRGILNLKGVLLSCDLDASDRALLMDQRLVGAHVSSDGSTFAGQASPGGAWIAVCPVPEPGRGSLLASGLVLLAGLRRRSRHTL